MKKLLFSIVAIGLVFLLSPSSSNAVSLNDIVITNYEIAYKLGKDTSGVSILDTKERITADFKNQNVNHGIERAIPTSYDGHSTSLEIISVTDELSKPLEFSEYTSNGNTVLRIGNPDQYVFGLKTYVINYTQKNVTKYFANTNSDEWYWDTNGDQWKFLIEKLSITALLDDSISSSTNGATACYFGYFGSTDKCNLEKTGNTYSTIENKVKPGQNITLTIGFQPGTFAVYKPSLLETLLVIGFFLNFVTPIISIPVLIYGIYRYRSKNYRSKERKPIVTEYIPPRKTSVSVSASIINKQSKAFSAQLIDLAVRHYLKIYQTKEKSLFKKAEYEIELIKDINPLLEEEKELLIDMFGAEPKIGQRFELKSLASNTTVRLSLVDNSSKVQKLLSDKYSLNAKLPSESSWFYIMGAVSLVASVLLLNVPFFINGVVFIGMGISLKPLTDKGLELARYLDGLKQYITIAETDRIKALQSPEGAEKVGSIDPDNKKQLIKLYESVLPYAILFGVEKEWNKDLGLLYESSNTTPIWLYGYGGAFNAMYFSQSISDLNGYSSYSSPSSSSTGGSGGGGSSGGGGGGGGGGGW